MLFYDKGCTIFGACAAEKSLSKRSPLNLRRLLRHSFLYTSFSAVISPDSDASGNSLQSRPVLNFFRANPKTPLIHGIVLDCKKNSITDMMKNYENSNPFNPALTARHVSNYSPSTARSNRTVRSAACAC
jgi:hypothetical protein